MCSRISYYALNHTWRCALSLHSSHSTENAFAKVPNNLFLNKSDNRYSVFFSRYLSATHNVVNHSVLTEILSFLGSYDSPGSPLSFLILQGSKLHLFWDFAPTIRSKAAFPVVTTLDSWFSKTVMMMPWVNIFWNSKKFLGIFDVLEYSEMFAWMTVLFFLLFSKKLSISYNQSPKGQESHSSYKLTKTASKGSLVSASCDTLFICSCLGMMLLVQLKIYGKEQNQPCCLPCC